MYGDPIVKSPDEFPLIQAAKLAISRTENLLARNSLNQYIVEISKDVEQSVQEGVTITSLINTILRSKQH
jgi:hypothetical protein